MGIVDCMRIPVIACVDALPNGAAIETRAYAFVWASISTILTEIAPFFNEMFTGSRVLFVTSEPGTLGVRSSMSAPSPAISRIRSSAECRAFLLVEIGTGNILSKTVGMLAQGKHLGFGKCRLSKTARPKTSILTKWTPPSS
jgi:hypothetical protein